MISFESFFKELTSDEQWFELATMHHKPETFRSVAFKVYVNACADKDTFSATPIKEHRKHVYNKLALLPGDKVKKDWVQIENEKLQKKEEEKKQKEWVPITGEERQRRLAEFKAIVDSMPIVNNFPRVSHKEEAEDSDWIPKKKEFPPKSDIEMIIMLKETKNRIRECRRKVFLEAFPDADEQEIHAYWQQFSDTRDDAL